MYPMDSPEDINQMIFKVEQINERPIEDPEIRKKIITFLESKRKELRPIMTEE
jgi:hypothetical protein